MNKKPRGEPIQRDVPRRATDIVREMTSAINKTSETTTEMMTSAARPAEHLKQLVAEADAQRLAFKSATKASVNEHINTVMHDMLKVPTAAEFARAIGLKASSSSPPKQMGNLPGPIGTAQPSRRAIACAGDVGHLVRTAREARNMTQQRFADLAGVGRRFVSELENGKATLEFDKVMKVAAAAGIDLLAQER
jgi:y4mF family transcriptional regulator